MSSEITCTIKSLTPIVTGDYNKKNKELLITGLRGSLRYQYWLIKAMEAWQKNNGSPQYPPYDLEQPVSTNKLVASLKAAGPVVQLFGTTGWRHLLHLRIHSSPIRGSQEPASARPFGKAPYHWTFELTCRPDREIEKLATDLGLNWEQEVSKLLTFVHHHGWLGAAPQNGFGWVSVSNCQATTSSSVILTGNPVFAARDILINTTILNNLKQELDLFYKNKKAEKKLIINNSTPSKITEKVMADIGRYKKSLELLENNPPPIGYEIRRFLKDQHFNNNKILGNGHGTSLVHVSHPIKVNNNYHIRLRFCNRPANGALVSSDTPENWLEEIENAILKPSPTSNTGTLPASQHISQRTSPSGNSPSATCLTHNLLAKQLEGLRIRSKK